VSALFGKGTSILVNAAIVPMAVRYLGSEGFGLWTTISSTIMMFFVLDIGIASSLTNLISEAYANRDRERAAACFATAFWVVIGISFSIGATLLFLWPRLDWVSIFNVLDPKLAAETSRAMMAAVIVFLFALPFGLVTKVFAGYQELHTANLFASFGNILALLAASVVIYRHGTLPALVIGYAASPVLANICCMIWLCYRKAWLRPRMQLIRRSLLGPIFRFGIMFFGIQVAGLVVFSSDSLVISHFLSPAQVTPYSITWRLMSYIAATQMLFFPALWPAYAEAFSRGDMAWIRTTYARVRSITIKVLLVGCAFALLAGRWIIRIWAGPVAVPSFGLIFLMCVWIAIFAFATNQSCLMGAVGRVGRQSLASLVAATVNLTLSIMWVKSMGPSGVLLATIVSYLVFILGIQLFEVRKILHGSVAKAAGPDGSTRRAGPISNSEWEDWSVR